jgi:AcrR family transcriptional regulator
MSKAIVTRAPGRPRDTDTETRILQAALQMLAREGYTRMSLDAVAVEAGVSKPTIYRRWRSKADLATAALRTMQLAEPEVDTGSTVGDLTATLENFCRSLMRPNGMALIGTVLAEEAHTPDLLALFRERLVAPRREMLRAILERAKKRKELRRDVSLGCAVNMLVGAFYARYLASSKVPDTYAAELTQIIWRGIAKQSQ